jgi:hypothetical protein
MEWVKVSDRLPDDSMRVLVTIQNEDQGGYYYATEWGCIYNKYTNQFTYWDDYFMESRAFNNVVAWMPLPELCEIC